MHLVGIETQNFPLYLAFKNGGGNIWVRAQWWHVKIFHNTICRTLSIKHSNMCQCLIVAHLYTIYNSWSLVVNLVWVMLETLPILLQDLYKLMWHPRWRVSHQQLKHHVNNLALTFKIIKLFKFTYI